MKLRAYTKGCVKFYYMIVFCCFFDYNYLIKSNVHKCDEASCSCTKGPVMEQEKPEILVLT